MLTTDHTCASRELAAIPGEQPGKLPNRSPKEAGSKSPEGGTEGKTDGERQQEQKEQQHRVTIEIVLKPLHAKIGASLHNEHAVAVREEPNLNLVVLQ